jgi:hypothetical protein
MFEFLAQLSRQSLVRRQLAAANRRKPVARTRIEVNKLEAARCQLETAIRLYFDYGDELSIHTLSGAAYAILHDLNKYRGGEDMLKDLHKTLTPEGAREFRRYINRPDNFLKHADRDPDETFRFDFTWTEVMIWEAGRKYCELAGRDRALMLVYVIWFVATNSEISEAYRKQLTAEGLGTQTDRVLNYAQKLRKDRRKFFAEFGRQLSAT